MKLPRADRGPVHIGCRRLLAVLAAAAALLAASSSNPGIEGHLASTVENSGNDFSTATNLASIEGGNR